MERATPWLDMLLATTRLLLLAIFTLVYLRNGLVYYVYASPFPGKRLVLTGER